MAESISFFQLDLSLSVSSFSRTAVSSSNSGVSAGTAVNGAAKSGINVSGGIPPARSSSDGAVISNFARALDFLRTSLVDNGFDPKEAKNYSDRFIDDPELGDELSALFILLEPLFDDKDKFRDNVKKFMANFAKLTRGSSSSQIREPLRDLASKIENIKAGKDTVTVADIAAVEISIDIRIVEGRVEITRRRQQTDPLILDMDGDGFKLTGADDGAEFDIDADGVMDKTAVTAGGDAMLALDLNGNGTIDNGKELFGEQNGAKDGFAELAKYDENADGVINSGDSVFGRLKLLRFVKNRAGGYEQKISPLAESGIGAINLSNAIKISEAINGGHIVKKSLAYLGNNGNGAAGERTIDIADALLENYRL